MFEEKGAESDVVFGDFGLNFDQAAVALFRLGELFVLDKELGEDFPDDRVAGQLVRQRASGAFGLSVVASSEKGGERSKCCGIGYRGLLARRLGDGWQIFAGTRWMIRSVTIRNWMIENGLPPIVHVLMLGRPGSREWVVSGSAVIWLG